MIILFDSLRKPATDSSKWYKDKFCGRRSLPVLLTFFLQFSHRLGVVACALVPLITSVATKVHGGSFANQRIRKNATEAKTGSKLVGNELVRMAGYNRLGN